MPKYALTISPSFVNENIRDLNVFYQTKYISRIQSNYYLYPEIAIDKDKNCRLHYHGVIEETDIIIYANDLKMLSQWCYICVKPISSMTKWTKYIRKEYKLTSNTLRQKDILINNINVIKPLINKNKSILDYNGFKKIDS